MRLIPLVAAALLGVLNVAVTRSDALTIVEKGRPLARIVVADAASEKVRAAAGELQAYLEKMSDARLPIISDTAAASGPLILVGASKLTEPLKLDIPARLTPGRHDEGYVIVCTDKALVLAGNNDGPYHGTEYAVYDLLRRLGVRWFMPGEYGEVVPRLETIDVPEINIREQPDSAMRDWWLHATPDLIPIEAKWKLRNRMNPDRLFAVPGDSTVRNVTAPAALLKEKPELFAMNEDGTRNPYLPNLSSPEAVAVAADAVKDYLRKNPGANSYGFAPDDGRPRDFNSATAKRNQGFVELGGRPGVPAEVSTSEEWFAFVNAVAAEVRKEFPEVYIATNGYANRDFPPQGMRLDDHLVLMFAAIWSCTLHRYDDAHCWQKVRQGQMLQRWCELCPNVWIYGYNEIMLVSGLTPLPEFTKLRRDFPLMKKWGVLGVFDESRNVWAEAGIASRYLRAQLEWNASADVDAILDDFFTKWYGAAAPFMKAFYFALDRAVSSSPMHGHEDRVLPEIYTPRLLAEIEPLVAQAERTADSDAAKLRVRADRLIFEHLAAYVAMSAADVEGRFADAAAAAQQMLDLRKELHAIDPFYIQPDESGYHTGIWY